MKRLLSAVLSVLWCAGFFSLDVVQAAEKYPVKQISFIVATEAGGDGDILVRSLMERVSKTLGQPIVIVNKPGAGSSIGHRELHRAKPDGYTLGLGSAPLITTKLQGISPLDHHDFTHLGGYAT